MVFYSDIKQKLRDKLPQIVLIICILQPIFDIISYWTDRFNISNLFTLALRLALMFAILAVGFILSKRKSVYYIMAAILIVLCTGHIIVCLTQGYSDIAGDLTNMVRIYHLPLVTLSFITFLRTDKKVYKSIIKGFIIAFIIIAAVELISVLTETNPYTYPNKELGILGWFYFANTQSAIISVLVTLFVYAVIQRYKTNFPAMLLLIFFSMGILFMFATRLTYAALLIIGLGMITVLLITDRKNIRPIISIALVTVIFAALLPFSPMYSNQKKFSENLQKEQNIIYELIEEYEAKAVNEGLSGEELKIARLEGVYNRHMPGLVERFGLKKTVEYFDYTESAKTLYNFRTMKLSYNDLLMEEYGTGAFLFGMELSDLTSAGIIHDVENDFQGIFYLCGASGMIMLLLFLGYFIIITVKALIINFRQIFNIRSAAWGIAFITVLLHVYATAGVLRRPNGSYYLSVILAVIYYLTKIKTASTEPKHAQFPDKTFLPTDIEKGQNNE